MARLEIHPFSDEFRGEAARLLAARHARERAAEPLLPEIEDYAAHVPTGEGAVATRGGEAVAYLVVEPKGDRIEAGLGGVAAAPGEAEAVRDLYGRLARGWPAKHVIYVPASERELLDVLVRNAFGIQFMQAVQETRAAEPGDFGGTLRPGTPDDLPLIAAFDRILWEVQAESPSFSGLDVEAEDFEAGWSDLWDDPELFPLHTIAERDGRAVGHILLYRRPTGDLRVPADNIDLAHAATRDDVRGSGVGLALTAHALGWAHEQGFRSMTTDWRSVNLFSSRFWPRRGFRPTHYRLYRAVP